MQILAIVGASLAGISAASAARAQGFAGRLIIIGDEPHRPYDRPPLSKDFLAGKITVEHLGLGTRLVIVGPGFIGAEVASRARAPGAEVTVVSLESVPLSRPFGVEMAAEIVALHGINGVELICDATIDSYDVSEGVVSGLCLEGDRGARSCGPRHHRGRHHPVQHPNRQATLCWAPHQWQPGRRRQAGCRTSGPTSTTSGFSSLAVPGMLTGWRSKPATRRPTTFLLCTPGGGSPWQAAGVRPVQAPSFA
jgi:hypothetical protein